MVLSVSKLKCIWRASFGVRDRSRGMVSFVLGSGGWRPVSPDYDYHQEVARAAFADMLHDEERNRKYRLALQRAIARLRLQKKQVRVLDIGTGTGLLSLMAAQMGADSIVACEAFKPMADCALKIIEDNGFKDKIQLIPKRSTDLTVGEDGDMKYKANILITEVFDTELIGEGAIETFQHAHCVLLEDDCIVIPDSATVYAQIVECPTLQRWNKITDTVVDGSNKLLEAPLEIKKCPGSAAVHDIQLSQLPRSSFREITKPIAIFQFDWTGKKSIKKNETLTFTEKSLITGSIEMIFMWWDLKMDPKGEILLSCAPWWNHPDADFSKANPENSIPWRDHWMQAVYYFPETKHVSFNDVITLHASHDEFSLWFNMAINDDSSDVDRVRPVCECGVHMAYSRTHVAYMNDLEKNKTFVNALKESIDGESICLCLNGASLIGLLAAKMGAKRVIYVESGIIGKRILESYIKHNNLCDIVSVVSDLDSVFQHESKSEISVIVNDPHFSFAILPWDNFKHGHYLTKLHTMLQPDVKIIPASCSVWVMSVEFLDLHKIKAPLRICEDIDLTLFDNLIKDSRDKSDDEIEAQPLWEYPCVCRSIPIKIADVSFHIDMENTQSSDGSVKCENNGLINAFVFWLQWDLNGTNKNLIVNGPIMSPKINKKVEWDPSIRQAVKILEEGTMQKVGDMLNYNFLYNPKNDLVSVNAYLDVKP
ncbi:arginine methyltransferase 7 [Arctopsyche grandis]|uniref:arginine methyltransferase 7 n=1 Tax=Arctopsyche grandis TaxID=121162 RepID=UPI00406D9B96